MNKRIAAKVAKRLMSGPLRTIRSNCPRDHINLQLTTIRQLKRVIAAGSVSGAWGHRRIDYARRVLAAISASAKS